MVVYYGGRGSNQDEIHVTRPFTMGPTGGKQDRLLRSISLSRNIHVADGIPSRSSLNAIAVLLEFSLATCLSDPVLIASQQDHGGDDCGKQDQYSDRYTARL